MECDLSAVTTLLENNLPQKPLLKQCSEPFPLASFFSPAKSQMDQIIDSRTRNVDSFGYSYWSVIVKNVFVTMNLVIRLYYIATNYFIVLAAKVLIHTEIRTPRGLAALSYHTLIILILIHANGQVSPRSCKHIC